MLESEDGTVTGSIDVSKLDEIDPKTDEAKAQLDALKAEVQAGQPEEPAEPEPTEEAAEAEPEKAEPAAEEAPKASMAMSKDELVAAATAAGVDAEGKTKAELVEALGGQA
jgi:hypothetical protein